MGAIVACSIAMTACSDSNSSPEDDALDPKGTLAVKRFDGPQACVSLEQHIEETAEAMMREQLEGFAVLPEGGVGDNVGSVGGDAPAALPERDNFSQTNVRQAGVDEPDPVKNDGQRLFSLRSDQDGLTLSAISLTPASTMSVQGQTRWSYQESLTNSDFGIAPERASGLFRHSSDTLLALSTSDSIYATPMPVRGSIAVDASRPTLCADEGCGPGYPGWSTPRTKVRNFDTSANGAPLERWLVDLPGTMLAARRIGSTLYVVTQSALRLPVGVRSVPDVDFSRVIVGSAEWRDAVARTVDENARIIRSTALADWLVDLSVAERVGGSSGSINQITPPQPTASDCAAFARIDVATRLSWMQVSTIDIDNREITQQTLLASGQGVYMSNESLFVFTSYWRRGDERNNLRNLTLLHRFGRDQAGKLSYDMSGSFAGRLINDYAIDEAADGTIRVAATDRDPQAYSYLATLRARDGMLSILRKTPRIAVGETLQSARFIGDRAYLVTFRQIDPFFVYDLSDGSRPSLLGELKLPGFSSYLHPVDSTHLLGIGYDRGGWPRRLKATLFDVTDPTAPREQVSIPLGDSFTDSDATWDPHAFTYYRPAAETDPGFMAVPVRSYASSTYGTSSSSGIRVLRVAPNEVSSALTIQGTVSMSDLLTDSNRYNGWRRLDARRAIFVDDKVYAVSDGAVRAATIADPSMPLNTVPIP